MKPLLSTLLVCSLALVGQAQEEGEQGGEESKAEDGPDAIRVLAELNKANSEKDVTGVGILLKDIAELGRTTKNTEEVEPIAAALAESLKMAKGNLGTLKKIVAALGELRTKTGAKTLKKIAFKKKAKTPDDEDLQAVALLAIAKMRDPKLVKSIGDMCKHRRNAVAKSAYQSLREFGPSKARVRKGIAELLMKRIEAEYPSAGGQSNKVSAEARERWAQLQTPIVASLQAVCRQDTINDIENWREWWKENKKNRNAWKDEKS